MYIIKASIEYKHYNYKVYYLFVHQTYPLLTLMSVYMSGFRISIKCPVSNCKRNGFFCLQVVA